MENQKQNDDDQMNGKYGSDNNNDDFVFVEDTMLSMDSNDLRSSK